MQDVTDNTCVHSWFNSPCTAALGADIYKATNIVRAFRAVGKLAPESGIPAAVLHGAAGFAILSIAKVIILLLSFTQQVLFGALS